MFCTNCGAEIKENATCCMSCGQKVDYNSDAVNQATENLSCIVGKKYSFQWKPCRIFKIPFSNKEITNNLEFKENRIDITGSVKLFGKPKFIKSINYNDISHFDCKIKPHNKTIELIIDIFSWLVAVGIVLDSNGAYVTLFNAILVILLCYVEPMWSASALQPVCLKIVEKNGNVTTVKGEKDCIQAAEEAAKNINILISK